MLNRNQKRFRKEMTKIQQEHKNGLKEPVFSYIEGDYIDYYSSAQRKIEKNKGRKVVFIFPFLAILMLVYAAYSRVPSIPDFLHSMATFKPNSMGDVTSVPTTLTKAAPSIPINPVQDTVIQYFKYVETRDQEMHELINYTVLTYGDAWKGPNQQRQYLDQVGKNQKRINQITAEVIQKKHPEELEEYYQTVIQKYKSMSQVNTYASTAVLNRDRQVDSQFRIELNNMNLLNQQQMAALTKGFDRVGIQWENTDKGITYHVRGL